jgi:hypothetical protein
VLEHRVGGMEQLDSDDDERLLGPLTLSPLPQVDRPPFGTPADGVDGGEIERMAGNPRAHRGQPGDPNPFPTLGDHGVEADIRDERPRIVETPQRPELPEQCRDGLGPDPGDRLQQLGIGRAGPGRARACTGTASVPSDPCISRRPRPASGQTLTVPSPRWRGELPRRLRVPLTRNVIPGDP